MASVEVEVLCAIGEENVVSLTFDRVANAAAGVGAGGDEPVTEEEVVGNDDTVTVTGRQLKVALQEYLAGCNTDEEEEEEESASEEEEGQAEDEEEELLVDRSELTEDTACHCHRRRRRRRRHRRLRRRLPAVEFDIELSAVAAGCGSMLIGDNDAVPLAPAVVRCVAGGWEAKGGKGGLGTLLKGAGRKMGKGTRNFGACRDLSGRRLRHVNDEIAIREYHKEQKRIKQVSE